jgi:Fe-Mn family superoxide dismutase
MKYTAQKFTIPKLIGISQKTVDEHIKLYEGYVKHTNKILNELEKGGAESYALSEMQRRLGFEFDGMRNHELYFGSLEGGSKELANGPLRKALTEQWGTFKKWQKSFTTLAKTRGVGWAILYYDTHKKALIHAWIDEQQFGHLTGCVPILAIDMWEHSFVADYQPSGKGDYIDDFFTNLNWEYVETQYDNATKA